MGRRGQRRALAPNIFEDGTGRSVKVTVGRKTKEIRFPPGTPLEDLEAARERLKGQQLAARPARAGTLRADVIEYLKTIDDPKRQKDQQILCAHWVLAYGHESRFSLTPIVIRQQLVAWRRAGAAASSCNHRLSALRAVFRTLNGPDEPNYPAQVKKLPEPSPEPRAIPYDVIAQIIAAMPDRGRGAKGKPRGTVSLTKQRLTFIAYSGMPPAQLARVNPATDIDWTTGAVRARPRRKGRGAAETWLLLVPQAVAALRALVTAGTLPGEFSAQAARKTWRLACVKVIRQQLRDGVTPLPHRVEEHEDGRTTIHPLVRPYDLRHSYATRALAVSGDLKAVQAMLQHASSRQTERYVMGAVPERAARAVRLLAESLSPVPEDPVSPTGAPSENEQ